MRVVLPPLYPWVLLIAGSISFECLLVGFVGSGDRRNTYSNEFMDQFKDEHGSKPPGGGYPDHGNGYYSRQLSYKDWYEFNLAQRSHKNLLEFVTLIVAALCIVGVVFPVTAVILGSLYLITAIIYKVGFTLSPEKRLCGNLTRQFTSMVILIMSVVACIVWISQVPTGQIDESSLTVAD